jgi:CheY-like chemotaxis protein
MMKIMYVEDNPANISLLQRIARMGGHEVINYTDGEKALERFADDKPDLVLMDLQLEGRITGLDVVKQLRERGFTTPIVAVTAYAMVGDRERCIEAGCDSYLSKPLPVAELVELVQAYERNANERTEPSPPVTTAAEIPAALVVETQEVNVLTAVEEAAPEATAPAAVAEPAAPTENS